MKHISKLLLFATALLTFGTACEKLEDLPLYTTGSAPVLSSSVASIAATNADAKNPVVTFSWSDPKYATDTSTVKFVVEIDSASRNFAKSFKKVVIGTRSTTFTGEEINAILLGYGFAFNRAYDMDVRVVSSYGNNNDQYLSNVLKMKMTPYKIPPKIVPPAGGKLFIIGSATEGGDASGWNNPVPTPLKEFSRLDETTFAGVFKLNGNKEFLILPVNGSWDAKFALASNTAAGIREGGDFGIGSAFNDNFKGPEADGWYVVTLDFQTGKFTIKATNLAAPENLFIVGDATPGQWNNPVPVPSQQFTRVNSSLYELTISLSGGKQYLLLPTNGSWDNKYALISNADNAQKSAGLFEGGGGLGPANDNFKGPDADGSYKISVNFATKSYKVTL